MKKTLLATTALVGAAVLAAPANAGTVGSKDAMNVTLGGMFWFSAYIKDEDVSTGINRGYGFTVSESEVWVKASNTADNGIKYGVVVELAAGAADTTDADEAFAYLSSPTWGTIQMGDQDDVTNQKQVGAWNATKGASGPFGGLGGLNTMFGGLGTDTLQGRADWQVITTSDDTKINYMTPNFSGFQLGASWTPDTGEVSGGAATADSDSDGDFENVLGISANYTGKFDGVAVKLSAGYESGTDENATGAEIEDLEVMGVGGMIAVGAFSAGVHWRDYGDTFLTEAQTLAGADGGNQMSVGLGYQMGPLGVSAWYLKGEKDNSTTASAAGATETEIVRYGLGAGYNVAPGWQLKAELSFLSHDNPTTAAGVGGTTDNDGKGFLLVNRFFF